MKDIFRKTMDKTVGPGGVRCYCCNNYKGKGRKALHRLVRSKVKEETRKEIQRALSEEYYKNNHQEE